MKTVTNSVVFQAMEKWAPKEFAYDWDNIGLQIGSYQNEVKNVLLTLDVTEDVVGEAIDKDVQLIIAHHPLLFKPLNQIDIDQPIGRVIQKLIEHNITVYAAHTNLDIAEGGVNDMLYKQLGLVNGGHLQTVKSERLFKIIVFVPTTRQEDVRNALSEAGAGHIGNYSHCTFQTNGKGTFKPLEGTNPYIGSTEQLEFVEEVKIETIVKERELSKVIDKMIQAHPYEEVAYDIYPVNNEGNTHGIGRVGYLTEAMTLTEFAEHVKTVFQLSHVRVTGDGVKQIKKVAVLGGSGEKFIHQAINHQADVYITGDMTFHQAQIAWEKGLAIIDAGHYIETVMKEGAKEYLNQIFGQSLTCFISNINTNPFRYQ